QSGDNVTFANRGVVRLEEANDFVVQLDVHEAMDPRLRYDVLLEARVALVKIVEDLPDGAAFRSRRALPADQLREVRGYLDLNRHWNHRRPRHAHPGMVPRRIPRSRSAQ